MLKTIAADKQCEVKLEGVKVGADALLGPAGDAWPIIEVAKQYFTVAYCAYLVGLAQRDFEISVDYAKERIQFGRPIGSSRRSSTGRRHGHRCRWLALHHVPRRLGRHRGRARRGPAGLDGQGLVLRRDPSSRCPRAADSRRHRLHKEYIIQLYFRRQKMAELMWGDADHHREKVAELLNI